MELTTFRVITVEAKSFEQLQSAIPFELNKNATNSYQKLVDTLGSINEDQTKDFCLDYAKKHGIKPGHGAYVVLQRAVVNKSIRPYKITNKVSKGSRKFVTRFQVVADSGLIIGDFETRKEARTAMEEAFKTGDFQSIQCRVVKQCIGDSSVVLEGHYNPSKGTQTGKYIVFGLE